jgi:hypothetical protein
MHPPNVILSSTSLTIHWLCQAQSCCFRILRDNNHQYSFLDLVKTNVGVSDDNPMYK